MKEEKLQSEEELESFQVHPFSSRLFRSSFLPFLSPFMPCESYRVVSSVVVVPNKASSPSSLAAPNNRTRERSRERTGERTETFTRAVVHYISLISLSFQLVVPMVNQKKESKKNPNPATSFSFINIRSCFSSFVSL